MKPLPKTWPALGFAVVWIAVSSCSSQGVTLVNPNSGATTKCSATGAGLGTGWAQAFIDSCIARYKSMGYVPMDELTPEQRTDLERRGSLPTD